MSGRVTEEAVQRLIASAISLIKDAEEVETADGLVQWAQLHLWHELEDAIEQVGPAEIRNYCDGEGRAISWPWLRGVIGGMPTRDEPISGQSTRYIQRDEVMAWINEGERRSLEASAPHMREGDLCGQLQQKCSDWGTYWRAPDAHGVILSHEQALELLRDALGVEVDFAAPPKADAVDLSELKAIRDRLEEVGRNERGHWCDARAAVDSAVARITKIIDSSRSKP